MGGKTGISREPSVQVTFNHEGPDVAMRLPGEQGFESHTLCSVSWRREAQVPEGPGPVPRMRLNSNFIGDPREPGSPF